MVHLKTLLAAVAMLSVPVLATTASAQVGYYPYAYYYQDPYTAHVQAEQEHMARERHHLWHERQARDEALRHGDFFGAWTLQQHMRDERHHLWHEQEHVDQE